MTDVDIIGNVYLQKHNKTLVPEFLSENKDQLNQIHSYLNALTPLLKILFFYSIVVDPSVLHKTMESYIPYTRNFLRVNDQDNFLSSKALSKNKHTALLSVLHELMFMLLTYLNVNLNVDSFISNYKQKTPEELKALLSIIL